MINKTTTIQLQDSLIQEIKLAKVGEVLSAITNLALLTLTDVEEAKATAALIEEAIINIILEGVSVTDKELNKLIFNLVFTQYALPGADISDIDKAAISSIKSIISDINIAYAKTGEFNNYLSLMTHSIINLMWVNEMIPVMPSDTRMNVVQSNTTKPITSGNNLTFEHIQSIDMEEGRNLSILNEELEMTIDECVEFLGISKKAVRKLRAEGKLKQAIAEKKSEQV